MMKKASTSILPLEANRVERFYRGGSGIDLWRKEKTQGDSFLSEDMMLATVPYIGPGIVQDEGYSHVGFDGKSIRLTALIEKDRLGFLGPDYVNDYRISSGIGCRVGDSSDERLVIQYHPDDTFARDHLGIPFGKTEAWYIVRTRTSSSSCFIGFREGVTKEGFSQAFMAGDSKAIETMMHEIPITPGDMILVPAGMIHAMGANTTFLELHNPCDYTFRLEREIAGRRLTDDELHYGLGMDLLLDGLSFDTFSEEEIRRKVVFKGDLIYEDSHLQRFSIIPYEKNPAFRVEKLRISGEARISGLESHMIFVATQGDTLVTSESSEFLIKQGYGAFVPFEASHDLYFTGNGSEIIIGFPFEVAK